MDAMSPVIVLLAAGESRRFDGIKQLVEIDGEPMLRRAAQAALCCGVPVIAVLGAQADRVGAALSGLPLHVVLHADWTLGMGSSLAAGMRVVEQRHAEASAVLVALADQPRVDGDALQRLLARHAEAPDRILATAYAGKAGPPAVFPRDCFAALAACKGDQGARNVLAAQQARVQLQYDIDARDVDTPGDLVTLTRPTVVADHA